MELRKDNIYNMFKFLVSNILCSLFQIIIMMIIGIGQLFLWFLTGWTVVYISGNSQLAFVFADAISYGVAIIVYGIAWFGFWKILFRYGMKWFYINVFFAAAPLIFILWNFDPTPNPMAMISFPPEPMFSSIVTATILVPIYSVMVYKFILQSNKQSMKKIIHVCLIVLVLGSIIFVSSWNLMHIIYR